MIILLHRYMISKFEEKENFFNIIQKFQNQGLRTINSYPMIEILHKDVRIK